MPEQRNSRAQLVTVYGHRQRQQRTGPKVTAYPDRTSQGLAMRPLLLVDEKRGLRSGRCAGLRFFGIRSKLAYAVILS